VRLVPSLVWLMVPKAGSRVALESGRSVSEKLIHTAAERDMFLKTADSESRARSFSVSYKQAITSISTSEFPGIPPAAAIVVRTGGSGPKLP
jgi:hypothetical protein